jgi:hypothetical protein
MLSVIIPFAKNKFTNLTRRQHTFLCWSKRPLPNGKARVKTKNVLAIRRSQEPISLKRFRRFLENFWPIFDPDSGGTMLYADMAPRIGIEKWLKKLCTGQKKITG